jgi:hypothetical protein
MNGYCVTEEELTEEYEALTAGQKEILRQLEATDDW